MIYVIGPRNPKVLQAINTTSRSNNWSKGLSPFLLGPVALTGANNHIAKNVENAWQFTKVYSEHLNADGLPSKGYFHWAKKWVSGLESPSLSNGQG